MGRLACLLGAVIASAASSARADDKPRISLGDGAFTLEPQGLLQIDAGVPFRRSPADDAGGGVNDRRARLGVLGTVLRDIHYDLRWDFGGTPGSRDRLYQASLAYHGPDDSRVEVGIFEPAFSLQQDASAKDLLFLERAAVTQAFAGIGAATASIAAELRQFGPRWFGAVSLSAGGVGAGNDSSQRAANLRLTGRPIATDEVSLHLGVSGTYSWRPPHGTDGLRGLSLTQPFALNVARQASFGPGFSAATDIGVVGGEFALSWRRVLLQAERYGLRADRPADRALGYSGFYAQLAYVIVGQPRQYQDNTASWGAPGQDGKGAVELGARFSRLDLNSRGLTGGIQDVSTLGLGWWPTNNLAATSELQRVTIGGLAGRTRRFDAVSLRLQAGF